MNKLQVKKAPSEKHGLGYEQGECSKTAEEMVDQAEKLKETSLMQGHGGKFNDTCFTRNKLGQRAKEC